MAVVIVQARMGSTRLPGKSLKDLSPAKIIDWVLQRCATAESISEVVLATSTNEEDDALVEHVTAGGWLVHRGHPLDVLDRYCTALSLVDDPVIVRITGDCPFVEPELIDLAVESLKNLDYVATGIDGRFPRGFDVEALRRQALIEAATEAEDSQEREHVTPFIVRRPDRFQIGAVPCPEWAQYPNYRLTLDEEPDLELIRAVINELQATPETLNGRRVIELLSDRPDLRAINAGVRHNIVD